MKIADKIREALKDGEAYTAGQIWQLVNGGTISEGLISISKQGARLRKIAGDDFIGRDQVERSAKGLAYRGSITKMFYYPKFIAGEKTYRLSTPATLYKQNA
jgi:hypothetical protein